MFMKGCIWTPRAVKAKIIIGSQGVRLYGLGSLPALCYMPDIVENWALAAVQSLGGDVTSHQQACL